MAVTKANSTPTSNPLMAPFASLWKGATKIIDHAFKVAKQTPQDKLQNIEARKKADPNQALPGQEASPALQALFDSAVDKVKSTVSKLLEPRFDAKDLYDASGNPKGADIQQNGLGDCYFVSTLGAIADQQPQRIKDAIQYDEKTGKFTVTLHEKHDSNGWLPGGHKDRETKIEVTQLDIAYNLQRTGGSTVDDNPGTDGPIWPAVMETAYAKMHDKNWSNGIEQGFDKIASGGFTYDAMFAVTGKEGEIMTVGSDKKALDAAYEKIDKALTNGQPITLVTREEPRGIFKRIFGKEVPQDGLVDLHAYELEGIRCDSNDEIMIKVRNPWATNMGVNEGLDSPDAVVEVKLKTLVETGGLGYLNVGPSIEK